MAWNIVYVDILWVNSNYRRQRIGEQVPGKVEFEVKSKGVKLIRLDTFDFLAKEFFELRRCGDNGHLGKII